MSNSSLVNYVRYSPYYIKMTDKKISVITPHIAAGVISAEGLGAVFQTTGGASNYGIGSDGRIGLYVDESNSAWTSNNQQNDRKAVTIEVSNSATGGDWPVSDLVLGRLVDLCEDICRRNGIPYLNFTGDEDGNMTMHCWYANKACPGHYLASKFPYIANEVNRRLGVDERDNEPAPWAAEAVAWATEKGIMQGDDKGNLRLRDNITREEMVVMLHRALEV